MAEPTPGSSRVYKIRTMEGDLAGREVAPPINVPVPKSEPVSPRPVPIPPPPRPVPPPPSASPLPLPVRPVEPLKPPMPPPPRPPEPPRPPPLPRPPTPPTIPTPPSPLAPSRVEGPKPVTLESLEAIEERLSPKTEVRPPAPPSFVPPAPPEPPPITPPARSYKKLWLLAGAAGLIIIVIIFEIWWFFLRGEEKPTISVEESFPVPESTLPQEEPIPEETKEVRVMPLLAYAVSETLIADTASSANIANKIKEVTAETFPAGTLLLLNIVVRDGGTERTVSLDEVAAALKVTINPSVMAGLTGEYNLFLLSSNAFDRSTCSRSGITRADCSGPRLGLVFKVKDAAAARSALAAWEPSMAQNLQALILAAISIGSGSFGDATYANIPIRYRNFPIDTMTIEYAVRGDIVLITTSKSSMFAAIDALK